MQLSLFVFEWQNLKKETGSKVMVFHLKKNLLNFSICEHLEKTLDFERLHYQNQLTHKSLWGIGRSQKDLVDIFHSVPCGTLCDHQYGHEWLVKHRTSVSRSELLTPLQYISYSMD